MKIKHNYAKRKKFLATKEVKQHVFFFGGGGGGCWIFLCSHHIPQHVPNSSSLLRPIYLPTILPQEN